jgi:formate dehydrogenase subunit delta
MDIDNLVRMANRIAEFFDAMPDRAEARLGVANHLTRYWEPRMRKQLHEHVRASGQPAVLPLVAEAVASWKDA